MSKLIARSGARSRVRILFMLLIPVLFTGCQDVLAPATDPGAMERGAPAFALISVEPGDAQRIDAGRVHSCALRPDGVIACWGLNNGGQARPAKSAATGHFTQVSLGDDHTCGLRDDGVIECWGGISYGMEVLTAYTGSFTQVTGGGSHVCALRTDGVVQCWGTDTNRQAPPVRSPYTGMFTEVSAGKFHTCALRNDGVVECWGGQNGLDSPEAPMFKAAATGSFVQIGVGANHSCAVRNDGVIECWGSNSYGEAPSERVAGTGSFTHVTAGYLQTCAVRNDGVIECWGNNDVGQSPATKVASSGGYGQVASGDQHVCAMRTGGTVECWGQNSFGEGDVGTAPAAPSSVTTANTGGQFTVTWNAPITDEVWFRVVRRARTSPIGTRSEWEALDDVMGVTEFIDTASTTGGLYQYRVRTCNLAGCSVAVAGYENTLDDAIPATPSFSRVTAISETRIDVEWNDVASESAYQLQRRASDPSTGWGAWSTISTTVANTVSYSDVSVTAGLYGYRLRACNGAGCSAWTLSGAVATGMVPAAPEMNVSGTTSAGSLYDVEWIDHSSDETRFVVQRSGRNTGELWSGWSTIAEPTTNTTTFEDTIPSGVDRMRYRTRACNAAGCSAWSAAGIVNVITP